MNYGNKGTTLLVKHKRSTIAVAVFSAAVLFTAPQKSETTSPGIRVEMSPEKPMSLRATLRSAADTTVSIYKRQLPWGSRYSLLLTAVLPNGQCLDKELPINDPSYAQVSIGPKESMTGDIDLQEVFGNLASELNKSEVLLFWAYEAPEQLHIPHWSGGWILISQHK